MKHDILIADDNLDFSAILERSCRRLGLNVLMADNAMTALEVAESHLPAAIILDVNMPRGNGLSVCEMITNHERLRDTPMIILTGNSETEIVKRCHRLGAYYIPKSNDVWHEVERLLCEVLELPPYHRATLIARAPKLLNQIRRVSQS